MDFNKYDIVYNILKDKMNDNSTISVFDSIYSKTEILKNIKEKPYLIREWIEQILYLAIDSVAHRKHIIIDHINGNLYGQFMVRDINLILKDRSNLERNSIVFTSPDGHKYTYNELAKEMITNPLILSDFSDELINMVVKLLKV